MSQAQTPAVTPQAPKFDATPVNAAAAALAKADAGFEATMTQCAENVARILTAKPTYELWEAVSAAFQAAYKAARGCNDETARKRWVAVAAELQSRYGQEKPAKPSAAGQKKAQQRQSASEEAAKLIAKAKATTPQEILSLATKSDAPLSKGVIAELGKLATEKAAEATKAAAEAAKAEAKKLRAACLDVLAKMDKDQLMKASLAIAAIAEGRTVSIRQRTERAEPVQQEPAKTE